MSGPGPVGDAPVGSQSVAAPEAADVTAAAASTATVDTRRDRRGTRLAVIGLAVMLIGSYAAAVALSGEELPGGTEVAGVDIGGLSSEAATDVLRRELVPRSRRPLDLVVGDRTFRIDPAAAGLSVNAEASVDRAQVGNRYDPRRLWADLTATVDPVAPVVRVDQDALIAAVHRLADRVNRPAVEPWIGFDALRPVLHHAQPGLALDTAQAIVTLLDAWLVQRGAIRLPVETLSPDVDGEAVQQAMMRLVRPATARPVRLLVGPRTVRLSPGRYAPALRFEVRGGALAPVVDAQTLARRLPQRVASGLRSPLDARVVLRGGRPTVLAARPGVRIRAVDTARAVVAALASRDRTARVAGSPVPARVSTRDARGWGIREPVASSSVDYRGADVARLASLVNGTVLRPGGTFSLGGVLGSRSDGAADADRLATALYGAALAAGMRDVEHHPHPVYDSSFPRGLDATMSWPDAGLRFAGTTPYGVLVQAWVTPRTSPGPAGGGQLGVRLWSTRYWDVTTLTTAPFDRVPPGRRVSTRPDCDPHGGQPGFSVDVVRTLHHGDTERSTTTRTTYAPRPALVCRRPAR